MWFVFSEKERDECGETRDGKALEKNSIEHFGNEIHREFTFSRADQNGELWSERGCDNVSCFSCSQSFLTDYPCTFLPICNVVDARSYNDRKTYLADLSNRELDLLAKPGSLRAGGSTLSSRQLAHHPSTVRTQLLKWCKSRSIARSSSRFGWASGLLTTYRRVASHDSKASSMFSKMDWPCQSLRW